MSCAYLILENGKTFKGRSFGATGDVISEIVFNTAMVGYLETLTDKSYYGQAVVQTFPSIGNYGVISSDFEGDIIGPSAYIVKEWCQEPSNFRSEGNLDAFLKSKGIIGLCDIDTRALTRTLRECGTMNGLITQNPDSADLDAIRSYKIKDAVKSVSVKEALHFPCDNKKFTVALLDLGFKKSTAEHLVSMGCEVYVIPYDSTVSYIKSLNPDGVMLSDGPGNPEEVPEVAETVKALMADGIPVFAVGLGHQIVALANGFKVEKLKHGHRGASQPVKNTENGFVHITSQNHGYCVEEASVDNAVADIIFKNANDGTCEGIEYKNAKALTVQFSPDICGGPRDTSFVLEKFIKMMEVACNA